MEENKELYFDDPEFEAAIRDGLNASFDECDLCVSDELIARTMAAIEAADKAEAAAPAGGVIDITKRAKRARTFRIAAGIAAAVVIGAVGIGIASGSRLKSDSASEAEAPASMNMTNTVSKEFRTTCDTSAAAESAIFDSAESENFEAGGAKYDEPLPTPAASVPATDGMYEADVCADASDFSDEVPEADVDWLMSASESEECDATGADDGNIWNVSTTQWPGADEDNGGTTDNGAQKDGTDTSLAGGGSAPEYTPEPDPMGAFAVFDVDLFSEASSYIGDCAGELISSGDTAEYTLPERGRTFLLEAAYYGDNGDEAVIRIYDGYYVYLSTTSDPDGVADYEYSVYALEGARDAAETLTAMLSQ